MEKAATHGQAPHVLVLTATPIPRTLSLTLYGDLDVSIIGELPPGRASIETHMTTESHLAGVWESLRREIAAGRQGYIVYPVIEESKLELKAAMEEYERRLRKRHTEDEPALQRRLAAARGELAHAGEYQHQVINDDLDSAVADLRAIVGGLFPKT